VVTVGAGNQVSVSDFQSYGVVTLNPGSAAMPTRLTATGGSAIYLNGGSRTNIGSAANPNPQLTVVNSVIELNGALLENNGTINGTVNVNYGSLAKGAGVYGIVNVGVGGVYSPGNSPGIVTASQVTFDNTPVTSGSPILMMELAGTTPGTAYDQLHVSGKLSLGGILQVSLVDNFSPTAGASTSFDILDWGTLSGKFSSVQLSSLNAPLGWDTSQLYLTGIITATAYLPGDINRDGQVTVADISALMTALSDLSGYQSSHPDMSDPQHLLEVADVDGDGRVTNADIQALISLVANNSVSGISGGSGGGSVAAVPEPASIVLLSFGALAIAFRRRCRLIDAPEV
jgi:hypothetical protein